jgi:hypothetical protein
MKKSPFAFLRATYWRWAEIIGDVWADIGNAPLVLAVGDIHLENFGTWRDVDGRLVWGVNDFDEAAEMPFVLDLLRLAASAVLGAGKSRGPAGPICRAILTGYRNGLHAPKPFVLDREHAWMRQMFVASEKDRTDFWDKMTPDMGAAQHQPLDRYLQGLRNAMPDPMLEMTVWPRSGGLGSLGRPRWVALAEWQGGAVVREAKAAVPSAWARVPGRGVARIAVSEITRGRYRAPDPWYRLTSESVIIRRLSPNARKIELKKEGDAKLLLQKNMLQAMGHELANVHLGVVNRSAEIERYLRKREDDWLTRAAERAVEAVSCDFERWQKQ